MTRETILSPKEMEVLKCVYTGADNLSIATIANITEATVRRHVQSITKKLGAYNRRNAVYRALEIRLLDLPPERDIKEVFDKNENAVAVKRAMQQRKVAKVDLQSITDWYELPIYKGKEEQIRISLSTKRLMINNKPVYISPRRFDLLALFVINPNKWFKGKELSTIHKTIPPGIYKSLNAIISLAKETGLRGELFLYTRTKGYKLADWFTKRPPHVLEGD